MTELYPSDANGQWATAADRQAAARQAYRQSATNGAPLTGAELGRRFNSSPRWGRDRVAEAQAEMPNSTDRHADSGRRITRQQQGHDRVVDAPSIAAVTEPGATGRPAVTSAVRCIARPTVFTVAAVAGAALVSLAVRGGWTYAS